MLRPILATLALALLLCGGLRAQAEDDTLASARADAREQLFKEAQRVMRSDGQTAIAALRRSLLADVKFADAYEVRGADDEKLLEAFRATIEERRMLVGAESEEKEGGAASGAMPQALRLQRWLEGRLPCEIQLSDPEEGGAPPRSYPFPPPQPTAVPAAQPKDAATSSGDAGAKDEAAKDEGGKDEGGKDDGGKEATGSKDEAAKGEPGKGEPGKGESGKDEAGRDEAGKKEAAKKAAAKEEAPKADGAKDAETKPKPAPAPLTIEEVAAAWAKGVRAAEGDRFGTASIRPAPCAQVDTLLQAGKQEPVYVHPAVGPLRRHAYTTMALFDYNLPSVHLRVVQAGSRIRSMQEDRPQPSLVDDAMVREKAAAVRRYAEGAERARELRTRLIADLDVMVIDLDTWKTQAALLAGEIHELRKGLGTLDAGDPKVAAEREAGSLPLRVAQARESLATMEITLLYHAAARAQFRLSLLEGFEATASSELRFAEDVHNLYEEALLRLRTARRLDRLERDRRALLRWRADAAEAADGSTAALRVAAYDALLKVADTVKLAVSQRRGMAAGALRADEHGGKAAPEAKDESAALSGPHLAPSVARPATATWDVKFIELAGRQLLDPTLRDLFGARLVADHYSAASEQMKVLLIAEHAGRTQDEMRQEFASAEAQAKAALDALQGDALTMRVRRLPTFLSAAADDFEAAMRGMTDQRSRNHERMRALASYQRLLRRQGTRSLLIRIDRSQRDPYFGDVMRDTRHALESAGAWASFQGETHAGEWLARSWLRILWVLIALAAAVFVVRLGRHMVDRRIDSMVATIPEVGASVREERERARRRRERSDKAARAITDEEVLNTAPTRAEPSPAAQGEIDAPTEAPPPPEANDEERPSPGGEGA